jgi:hypothetical protein
MRPFAATSSWNMRIPDRTIYVAIKWPKSTGYNYCLNHAAYSPAVYVSIDAEPMVDVAIPATWGYPAGVIKVRLPKGVTGAVGTDGELLVIDGATVHNFWKFTRTSGNTATASAYGRADALKDSGWGSRAPFRSAGIVAAGSSQLAGLLVQAETDAGEIEHALQIALDGVLQKPGFVGEAISGDGANPKGISIEGERLAIPRTAPMPAALSPLGQKVFRALRNYGAFNIDVAGGCSALRAQSNAYDAATIATLWADLSILVPMLHRVELQSSAH